MTLIPAVKHLMKELSIKRKVRLTPRQTQVLVLVSSGLTSRAIGERLGISKRTVDVHRYWTMKQLGCRNVVQLIRTALEQGLITSSALAGSPS